MQGDARLSLEVEMPLADVDEVVLRRIAKAVDRLKRQCLFVGQELDLAIGRSATNAMVKANRVRLARSRMCPPR
jgi:hypothetical protein